MFFYTVKASRIKFFALLLCSMAVLLTIASVLHSDMGFESVAVVATDYSNITDNDDRVKFLNSFGYTVNNKPIETVEVRLPEQFDSVFTKYNDIQRAQGLNLKKYSGKTVTRYTYEVTDYRDDGKVYANLLIYNGSIIGGDVCCNEENGFIHGFEKPKNNQDTSGKQNE